MLIVIINCIHIVNYLNKKKGLQWWHFFRRSWILFLWANTKTIFFELELIFWILKTSMLDMNRGIACIIIIQHNIRTLNDWTNVQSNIRIVYPCRSSFISLAARKSRRNPTFMKFSCNKRFSFTTHGAKLCEKAHGWWRYNILSLYSRAGKII